MTADPISDASPSLPRKLWKTALFLAGSLALSGVALALWNRGELSRLRSHPEAAPADAAEAHEEEII